ncbi:hypothetical protein RchiOBHm_Chr2g0171911 [Rosa chinensis]|uniref:Uncharacterized protein n=1 Tax=Rosa chinensis TaxID=74649 RepID=A0A2P6S5I3_ROSCH|nr:hypothetical protein RchiOBHm_Chr2g0171911 [Rosa chinensis]
MGVPCFRLFFTLRNPSSQFTPRSSNSPEHLSCEHFGASLANVEELNAREQRKEAMDKV